MPDQDDQQGGAAYPTPHYDKLQELLSNQKLPVADRANVEAAIQRYVGWISLMDNIPVAGDEKVKALVESLNDYKRFVELNLVWDSEAEFLFRQRGQIKLDSSVIEEFLPRLVDPAIIPALGSVVCEIGPRTSFAGAYFATSLPSPGKGAGLQLRAKAQDFTIGRTAFLRSSFDAKFPPDETLTQEVYLASLAAECKTNLDKTMFQEAAATARDLKTAVAGARYYLLCEWLDMAPLSTRATSIDEVIILRGKRLSSNVRSAFSDSTVRRERRLWYEDFLRENPVRLERIMRFVEHLRALFDSTQPAEESVLALGYF